MDKPVFTTRLPGTKQVTTGDSLILEVVVTAPDDVTFRWLKADQELKTGTGAAFQRFEKADPTADDSGAYSVLAWRGTDPDKTEDVSGGTCTVTVGPAEPAEPPEQPGEWDPVFADTVLRFATWAGAALLALIVLVAVLKASIAWTVSVGLLAIAAVLAAGGIAVALIDLRGRARAAAALANNARGLGSDAVQAAADILKAWGSLGLASAMLALGAVSLIASAALGWRSVPDPGPASATPTASAPATATPSSLSPSASPSTAASSSAAPSPARS